MKKIKIKENIDNKALDVSDKLKYQAQAKFISFVMKEEDVDYETAVAICMGRTDPIEHEYTLGYKISDPVLQLAIHAQPSKKGRQAAINNFEKTLTPEELILFRKDVLKSGDQFKEELKRQKKA